MPVTESEAYLESLARKSFLSMWSHSNLFFGDASAGKGGKELCDLLVLFRNNVLLFSDKSCQYPGGPDHDVNWKRWHKRSVRKSVDQLIGARRTLIQGAFGLYTDAQLHDPFPLRFPTVDQARFFLITVSHGTESECLREHGRSTIKVDSRLNGSEERLAVGVRFNGHFVHVLDDSTLDIMLTKLDTIADFVAYLEAKEEALSQGDIVIDGEENLLAAYLKTYDHDGRHCIPAAGTPDEASPIRIASGAWEEYTTSESFHRSVKENRISYNIDLLIEHFTESIHNGCMITGQDEPLTYHEDGLRLLAAESRLGRRAISASFVSILREEDTTTFWASTVPSCEQAGVRYVFLTYPEMPAGETLEACEQFLDSHLAEHILVARHQFRDSNVIVGIAVPNSDCSMKSHFIRVFNGSDWTSEDHQHAAALQKRTGLFLNMEEERYIHIE